MIEPSTLPLSPFLSSFPLTIKGLLCLPHAKNDLYPVDPIYLWNPVVRKVKKLPQLDIELEYVDRSYLCFGYYEDDYKVINMVSLRKAYHVYVYSLSTGSWKFLKFNTNSIRADGFDIWPYPKARFVNGVAYFIRKEESRCIEIVSFDLGSEMIRRIKFPQGLNVHYGSGFIMEEYRDSIAILQSSGSNVVMWVLRVDNNSILWDEKFVVEFQMETEYYFQVRGFMNRDKLVIRMINRHSSRNVGDKYILYDIENNFRQPYTIPVKAEASSHDCPQRIYELTGSLVLLTETSTPCQKMQPISLHCPTILHNCTVKAFKLPY